MPPHFTPFRAVIKYVGEEKSAKLKNNKLFEHDKRANGGLFVAQQTCLCCYTCFQIMYQL